MVRDGEAFKLRKVCLCQKHLDNTRLATDLFTESIKAIYSMLSSSSKRFILEEFTSTICLCNETKLNRKPFLFELVRFFPHFYLLEENGILNA